MKSQKKSIKIDEKRQTRKSNNDHWEPDRPEIEKVNKRFKKKMIGFGRPDEIEKKDPGRRPPHAASKNVPNQTCINENDMKWQSKSMK